MKLRKPFIGTANCEPGNSAAHSSAASFHSTASAVTCHSPLVAWHAAGRASEQETAVNRPSLPCCAQAPDAAGWLLAHDQTSAANRPSCGRSWAMPMMFPPQRTIAATLPGDIAVLGAVLVAAVTKVESSNSRRNLVSDLR